MNIDSSLRRLRIVGTFNDTEGCMLHIYDGETGHAITNIARVELTLDAGEPNVARVFYEEHEPDSGCLVTDDQDKVVTSTVTVHGVEVDVTAYELAP